MRQLRYGLMLATVLAGASAAQVDDRQTDEYERQDRLYLERLRQTEEAPPEHHAQGREAFLAKAEQLIRDRHYDSRTTEHYRVQTDDIRLLVDETGDLLESFYAYFQEFWADRLDLSSAQEEVSRVFLFRSFYKYNQLLQSDYRRVQIRPKGHYLRAFDIVVAHTGADLPRQLPDALIHEAAHQLVERRIYAGAVPALWVSEGMASYFGYTYRAKDGTFDPGVVGGKSVRLIRDIAPGQSREGAERLRTLKKAAKELQETDFVDNLIRIRDPAEFYGSGVDLNYAGSWLLVHFLLHGEDGRHAEAFAAFLRLDARGAGAGELYRGLGLSPQELHAGFFRHLRSVKAK